MSAVIIGLTGQSGAGKSTVSRQFSECGFLVIDCDSLTHELLLPATDCSAALEKQFPDFFTDAVFDRRKAAPLLFSDPQLLTRYTSAIFPFIVEEIEARIRSAEQQGEQFIMLDAPTLFEAGQDKRCDIIVSCIADEDTRLRRITERDGISEENARKRFSSQHDDEFFRRNSDFVIENNGTVSDALQATKEIAEKIKKKQK